MPVNYLRIFKVYAIWYAQLSIKFNIQWVQDVLHVAQNVIPRQKLKIAYYNNAVFQNSMQDAVKMQAVQ